jgi:hypothetical protein
MAKSVLEQQLQELEKLRKKGTVTEEEYQQRRTALVTAPTGLAQVPKSSSGAKGAFKFGMFGCLGIIGAIIAVIVVIVIIVVASAGGDDSTPASGGTSAAGGDVHVAFAANASGEVAPKGLGDKKVRVTILQTAADFAATNQFSKPAAGKKFYGVEVLVEASGKEAVTTLSFKLRDSKDLEYDPTIVVGGPGDALDFVFQLTPGGKKQGWVYFEIAKDATPKWLRADPNVFLANDIYFDVK